MRRTDQVWLAGGLVLILALIAGGWFLFISPKFGEADDVDAEADTAQSQLIKLNKENAALDQEEKKKATYVAQLKVKQTALPTRYDMPAFVRQLQDTGTKWDVNITQLGVGSPVSSVSVPSAVELPITLTADGDAADLTKFLTALQSGSRAVLVKSVAITSDTTSTQASILISAFCVPPTGKTTVKDSCEAS
ncbi:type 4a pilus biogenesis protein PilO [Actinoplanes sp. TBRC 11911]|uniref:type 4a pilus biogenesis protein PilO n=1 Tax=Actinoplanes sp. TBRC 11911 TaxID=2729386 RepID=UPI00145FA95B|nr:type 4a pilus biogenesis protein PilO [Actinoplanes sp. TBRC 11911]NMO50883.1 type 4a pilus biogenesis protein PilO [Actinoplanes sp. TBRC 11911]